MKTGHVLLAFLGVVLLGALGWWLTGGVEGALAGLLALLPSGRRRIAAARAEGENAGKLDQAEADRDAAQDQRDHLAQTISAIDQRTEQDVRGIHERWDARRDRPPTPEEEEELLGRFRRDS